MKTFNINPLQIACEVARRTGESKAYTYRHVLDYFDGRGIVPYKGKHPDVLKAVLAERFANTEAAVQKLIENL